MTDFPTFWQAFEFTGRLTLAMIGGALPMLMVVGAVLAALEYKAIARFFGRRK